MIRRVMQSINHRFVSSFNLSRSATAFNFGRVRVASLIHFPTLVPFAGDAFGVALALLDRLSSSPVPSSLRLFASRSRFVRSLARANASTIRSNASTYVPSRRLPVLALHPLDLHRVSIARALVRPRARRRRRRRASPRRRRRRRHRHVVPLERPLRPRHHLRRRSSRELVPSLRANASPRFFDVERRARVAVARRRVVVVVVVAVPRLRMHESRVCARRTPRSRPSDDLERGVRHPPRVARRSRCAPATHHARSPSPSRVIPSRAVSTAEWRRFDRRSATPGRDDDDARKRATRDGVRGDARRDPRRRAGDGATRVRLSFARATVRFA